MALLLVNVILFAKFYISAVLKANLITRETTPCFVCGQKIEKCNVLATIRYMLEQYINISHREKYLYEFIKIQSHI